MEWVLGAALVGLIFVYLAARLGREARRASRRVQAMAATQTTPCGHVAALAVVGGSGGVATTGGDHTQCVGQARAGPHGLLTAPFSGTPCVWHRSVTARTKRRYVQESGYELVTRVEAEDLSEAPFVLADASGQVLIDPRGAENDLLCPIGEEACHRFDPDPKGHDPREGRDHREWLILPDQELYVLGEAGTRDGWVTLHRPHGRGSRLVISTGSEEELAATSRSAATTLRWLAIGFAVAAVLLLGFVVLQIMG